MTERPKWVRELHAFVTDTIIDEQFKYPMDGSDDEILDRIEAAVNGVLCAEYGHDIEHDQCGIPSHQHCVWCHRGIVGINHMEHAKVCNCLDDAAECCVESCPCPRVSHSRNHPSSHRGAMTPRCLQCGWTIAPGRQEDITDNAGNIIPLHRGGCPTREGT